jgi:peptidoglycan/LPS O-acetylase OafA/YrhL
MKLNYRPEIDGLRAIAVVSVILYHAQIYLFDAKIFSGGYIGVDIFFVISGYLITLIILKEFAITGSLSLKYFYERRIRRILPALLLVILMSFPLAWLFLLPLDYIDFAKSVLYSLGFSSNFYFHYSGQQYGATNALFLPFLHTWSLSVEEQFYIIFPIIFLTILRYFKNQILYFLIFGIIISLFLAEWGSKNYPSSTFYFLHTRTWELLLGSLLAYFEYKAGHRSKSKKLNLILPSIGLLLIVHYIFFSDFNDMVGFHPSFHSIYPVFGVCLIIWFSAQNELTTKILSSKLFVSLGLISYSLYLWHYPIFSFARITGFIEGDLIKKILIGLIILTLSLMSYFLIEKPSRDKKLKFKLVFYSVIASYLIIITVSLSIIFNKGYINRIPETISKNLIITDDTKKMETKDLLLTLKNEKKEMCHDNLNGCSFNENFNKKIYLIGDSHMAFLSYDLKNKAEIKKYHFNTSTRGTCFYFPGFNLINAKTKKIDKLCNEEYFFQLEKKLLEERNSIIIIGGRLPMYLSGYKFNNKEGGIEGGKVLNKYSTINQENTLNLSFKKAVNKLLEYNKVMLIYPIPEVGFHVPKKIWNNRKIIFDDNKEINKIYSTSFKVFKERTETSFELLDSIKGNNIFRVYPHKLFCNTIIQRRCITNDAKNIFYYDDDHLSIKGVDLINNKIIEKINQIEKFE